MTQEMMEEIVRSMLLVSPDSFKDLDRFVEIHESEHPDGLSDYVFRLAIQTGKGIRRRTRRQF